MAEVALPDEAADPVAERRAPYGYPVIGERGEDARRRILAATLDTLKDVGYDDLRIELITKRVGCSRPTFYQYFSSKQDVFWTLGNNLGREMVAFAETIDPIAADLRGVERLTSWVAGFLELHDRWAPVFTEFPAAAAGREQAAHESQHFSVRTATALLRAFGLRDCARERRKMGALLAVVMRASFYAEMAPPGVHVDAFATALAQLLHRTYHGPIRAVNLPPTGAAKRRRFVAPPAPRPRPALGPKSERTRQKLLDAGLTVFRERGFRGTSVDDLASAAQVSHGTFYRYFANLERLVLALAELAGERTCTLLAGLDPGLGEAQLRTWLGEWFAAYHGHGGIISIWQERPSNAALTAYSRWVASAIFSRLVTLLAVRDFGDAAADATIFLALLERVPYSVSTLGYLSEAEGIDITQQTIRRGFFGT